MKSVTRLTIEIKKLNEKLDRIGSQNRFMVYSTSPWRFASYNFIAGVFYSLGILFGTAVIATSLLYLSAKYNFTNSVTTWMESTLSQIRWERILNMPSSSNQNFKVVQPVEIGTTLVISK